MEIQINSLEDMCDLMCGNVVPEGEDMSRWIPVSERLPELHENYLGEEDGFSHISNVVLVSVHEGDECRITLAFYEERWGWTDDASQHICHPIAWMPLPEPYKEDKG